MPTDKLTGLLCMICENSEVPFLTLYSGFFFFFYKVTLLILLHLFPCITSRTRKFKTTFNLAQESASVLIVSSLCFQNMNTSGFRACVKELYATRYDPLSVSYVVLTGL